MIVAGIDVGGKNVHVVIARDGNVPIRVMEAAGIDKTKAAGQVFDKALKQAQLKRTDIDRVVATGSSGQRVSFADGFIPDAAAVARGVVKLIHSARTIIDVGAEEGRAIKINVEGKVLDFAINERCAAGTGTFIDTMARALEIPIEEMAKISLQSTRSVPMNAQCAVFGESEVVSLIHQNTPKQDIARAVHDAIAGRVGSVARIVGLVNDVVMVGGLANNAGFVESLQRELGMDVKVPEDPDFVSALGAAEAAAAGILGEQVKARVVERMDIGEGKV
jgi:predicted CoA-substrate-specific enzyme activase